MAIADVTVRDGALRTDTVNTSGIPIDMEPHTKDLVPNRYTTRAMVRKFGNTVMADSMEHKYRERRPIPNWTTISVADAIGQTNIEVADPTYIQDDHVLWIVRNGKVLMQLLVQDTDINATVAVVVLSGTTGSGALTVATEVNDIVVIGPEAHAEGEAVPDPYTNISTNKTDYLMQVDRAVKKTDIESHQGHYDSGEKQLAKDRKFAWIETMIKLNLCLYFGYQTKESTSASRNRYVFNGLFNRLTENVENYAGVGSGFTQQGLQEIIRKVTDEGPAGGNPVFVVGANINNHISSWPDGSVRVSPEAKKWGMKINTIQTQYGDVDLVYDNVLNAKYGVADRGVILEQSRVRQMNLRGLPVRIYANIEANRDIHNKEDGISGTWGIQASGLECFAQVKGVN